MASQYPYPSTLNVGNFVSIKLSKDNYKLWETQMFCLIESQNLLDFIDSPQPQTNQLWKQSDRLLKGWILGSLTEDVLATVVGLQTASDVWTKLKLTFGPHLPSLLLEEVVQLRKYLPLYEAAIRGDWEAAKRFFDHDSNAVAAKIAMDAETTLHIAAGIGKRAIHFVEKLVELMPIEALCCQNTSDGDTALSIAATVGNTAAVRIMVEKNPDLLYIGSYAGRLPVHYAAQRANKDTLSYLLNVTKANVQPYPFNGISGNRLLVYVIRSGFIGMAFNLVKSYPHLASPIQGTDYCPVTAIARNASVFLSGSRFNFLESLIYSCIPIKKDDYSYSSNGNDIENRADSSNMPRKMSEMVPSVCRNYISSVWQRFRIVLWEVILLLVPHMKHIGQMKLDHHQSLELVKCFCKEIKSSKDEDGYKFNKLLEAVHVAASLGIHEFVEEVVSTFPDVIWMKDLNNHSIFQLAVIHRCEKVFNLVYQMSDTKKFMTWLMDSSFNNILHLAGRMAPTHKLNLVSGAALQMQREWQWFKEVEKFGDPLNKDEGNSSNDTPAMVFTKEHKNLVVEGEKWMKDTANSCSFIATLITTVAFAATFTVPGGNSGSSGLPIFSKNNAFIVFLISDAMSLFTSATSLLMFLSILTARYAEEDFHYILPKRLILGLVTLFLSITSMMITFCAALYLVFGQKKAWTVIPVAVLASLPVTSFVTLQFPLVAALISSTFGHGIFRKQSDRPFR